MAKEKDLYVVVRNKKGMDEAGYVFLRETKQFTGDDLYIYFNTGKKSKLPYVTKKDMVTTNKIFL